MQNLTMMPRGPREVSMNEFGTELGNGSTRVRKVIIFFFFFEEQLGYDMKPMYCSKSQDRV